MKRTFFSILHKLRITRFAAWWNRKRVIILCYHGVTERHNRHPSDQYGLHIRADRFETQLNYLRRHYNVISLAKFLEARRDNKPLPERSVVLTFDDGYRNFLTSALPRLAAGRRARPRPDRRRDASSLIDMIQTRRGDVPLAS